MIVTYMDKERLSTSLLVALLETVGESTGTSRVVRVGSVDNNIGTGRGRFDNLNVVKVCYNSFDAQTLTNELSTVLSTEETSDLHLAILDIFALEEGSKSGSTDKTGNTSEEL
jgi:hypothetical protein